MKILLWFAVAGFGLWAVSDIIEAIEGQRTPAVYYLTSAYHALGAVGVWGIHRAQSDNGWNLSTIATAMQSIGLASVIILPLQMMSSGLEPDAFVAKHPYFLVGGLLNVLGMMTLGAAIWRCGVYPRWTALVIPVGAVAFIALGLAEAGLIANFANVLLAGTFVFLAGMALSGRVVLDRN